MNQTMEAPPSALLVAGKYRITNLIGRGGMGSVWEGVHATLGTSVAIKFIEAEHAQSAEARQRFDNEARAAATIQSKYAIQIFDHGVTEDGKPYIVMEKLIGEPLDKRLERIGRLPLADTARIIGQVSRALAKAHERGIVHRDLKPENIFLVHSQDDDEEIAKVLDFGIAKFKPAGQGGISSSTKTGAVLGTPYYMSPEQARGLRTVDHRTDVWSLGVIAYRSVVGQLPFDGESIGDLLVKICVSPLPVPSQVEPNLRLPAGFDAWFARALEREVDRRFGSVMELADALAFAAGLSRRGTEVPGSNPMYSNAQQPPYYPQHPSGGMGGSSSGAHQIPPANLPMGGSTGAPFTRTSSGNSGGGKAIVVALAGLLVFGAVAGGGVFFWRSKAQDNSGGKAQGNGSAVAPPQTDPLPSATATQTAAPDTTAAVAPLDPSATVKVPVATAKPGTVAKPGLPVAQPATSKPAVAVPGTKPGTPTAPVATPVNPTVTPPVTPPVKPGNNDPGF